MQDLKTEELNIKKTWTIAAHLRTFWLIPILLWIAYIVISIIGFFWAASAGDSDESLEIGILFITGILILILSIVTSILDLIFNIWVLILASQINSKYLKSGTGKLLIIIGFFFFIVQIVGAFILTNELKMALVEFRKENFDKLDQLKSAANSSK